MSQKLQWQDDGENVDTSIYLKGNTQELGRTSSRPNREALGGTYQLTDLGDEFSEHLVVVSFSWGAMNLELAFNSVPSCHPVVVFLSERFLSHTTNSYLLTSLMVVFSAKLTPNE